MGGSGACWGKWDVQKGLPFLPELEEQALLGRWKAPLRPGEHINQGCLHP